MHFLQPQLNYIKHGQPKDMVKKKAPSIWKLNALLLNAYWIPKEITVP